MLCLLPLIQRLVATGLSKECAFYTHRSPCCSSIFGVTFVIMTTGLSSNPSAASLLKTSSGEKVREKFLNMIGIEAKLPPAGLPACNRAAILALNKTRNNVDDDNDDDHPMTTEQAIDPSASITWVNPRTQNVVCFTESLKYDRDADRMFSSKRRKLSAELNPSSSPSRLSSSSESSGSSSSRSSDSQSMDRKPKKTLTFGDSVKVVPIPMRNEYSNRVRSRLWSNATEIYENAARNAYEFAAEGYVCMCFLLKASLCPRGRGCVISKETFFLTRVLHVVCFLLIEQYSWDWRTVIEDEGMYVCATTGELIHPCHYQSQATE